MRYELSDYEWTAIMPMPPNKPRGVRRVNDRRVLNESLPASRERGRTFRRSETARTRFASALICIAHRTWSNGSSTRSSNVGVSRPNMTSSQPIIWHRSNPHQSKFGYVLM